MELNKANKNLFIDISKGKFNHGLYKHTIDFNYNDEILTVAIKLNLIKFNIK